MQCTYCAEQIQDQAKLCRFCGARKINDAWVRPEPVAARPKFTFFFRSSGFLFVLSAVFELVSFDSPVPLFGALRGGVVAPLYHGLFAASFLAIGLGLWRSTRWAYRAVLFGTALYTADRLLYLFDHAAQEAYLATQLALPPELQKLVEPGAVEGLQKLIILGTLLGFWFFALLVHRRRSEFSGGDA